MATKCGLTPVGTSTIPLPSGSEINPTLHNQLTTHFGPNPVDDLIAAVDIALARVSSGPARQLIPITMAACRSMRLSVAVDYALS